MFFNTVCFLSKSTTYRRNFRHHGTHIVMSRTMGQQPIGARQACHRPVVGMGVCLGVWNQVQGIKISAHRIALEFHFPNAVEKIEMLSITHLCSEEQHHRRRSSHQSGDDLT